MNTTHVFPQTIYSTPPAWGSEELYVSPSQVEGIVEELDKIFGEGEVDPADCIEWRLMSATDTVAIYGRTHSYTADGKWVHQQLTVALRHESEGNYEVVE